MNSLTETARLKIVKESHKYTIDDTRCGPLLYKFIMSKASIDTRATLSHIRENLASLDVYMAKVSNNIIKFNEYVTEQRLNLKARGGVTHDLLTNLWKAYSSVQDSAFVSYIQRKRDAYDEGEDIDVEELMKQAENKFKTLVLEEKWNSKTKEQHQIISLTAEINKLKDQRVRLGRRNQNSNKNASSSNNLSNQSKFNSNSSNQANKNSNQRFKEK